mgnify:CR=1 FL=1
MNLEEPNPEGRPEAAPAPAGPGSVVQEPGRGTRPIPLAGPGGFSVDAPRPPLCCWVAVAASLTSVVLAILLWQRTLPAPSPAPVAAPVPQAPPPPAGSPEAFQAALKPYLDAAQAGDPNAMRMLGAMYYHGLDLPRNRAEGLRWYRKAAESGSAVAKEELRQLE